VTAVVVTAVVVTAVVVTAAMVGTGPARRRGAPAGGGQPHSGQRTVSARLRGCLEACGRL
jgi:hypothetical protein